MSSCDAASFGGGQWDKFPTIIIINPTAGSAMTFVLETLLSIGIAYSCLLLFDSLWSRYGTDLERRWLQMWETSSAPQWSWLRSLMGSIRSGMTSIGKRPWLSSLIIILVLAVIVYFVYVYHRVERSIAAASWHSLISVKSMISMHEFDDCRLCDVYVASSYKSYLPCTYTYDYASTSAITHALTCGARLIDLDVFEDKHSHPIVANGNESTQTLLTTSLSLEDCLHAIQKTAFNPKLLGGNAKDPLFIKLNFRTLGKHQPITTTAHIIKKYLGAHLLPPAYAFQGRDTHVSLGLVPLKQLAGRVVIIVQGDLSNSKAMDELCNVNLSHNTYNGRIYSYDDFLKGSEPIESIQKFNTQHLSCVVPETSSRSFQADNFFTALAAGCQFLCMPYGIARGDPVMTEYMTMFKSCSFVKKPQKLRYAPVLIDAPKPQTEKVSFAPKVVQTPSGATFTV